jgi:hypothetical protein
MGALKGSELEFFNQAEKKEKFVVATGFSLPSKNSAW